MPNRIIKESICTSDTIDQMTWFEECFWNRLIVNCDDYGRFDARPSVLKSRLFPLKERITLKDIEGALYKLADVGCVRLYACDGRPYLYLPTWEVHQQIRAKKSKYPAPDVSIPSSDIKCNQMQSDESICSRNPIQSESESESNTNPPSIPPPGEAPAPRRRNPSTLSAAQQNLFNRFWNAYPRKESIGDAEKAWAKLNADEALTDTIIAAVERAIIHDHRFREKQFTPHPASWLNGKEWMNEYEEPQDPTPPRRRLN